MIGIPTHNTTNSPTATVSHENRNESSKTRYNLKQMMNIYTVDRTVFYQSKVKVFMLDRDRKTIIPKLIAEWATPNTRSYHPSGENRRLYKKTPSTIPKKYFLLNTMR